MWECPEAYDFTGQLHFFWQDRSLHIIQGQHMYGLRYIHAPRKILGTGQQEPVDQSEVRKKKLATTDKFLSIIEQHSI